MQSNLLQANAKVNFILSAQETSGNGLSIQRIVERINLFHNKTGNSNKKGKLLFQLFNNINNDGNEY